MFSRPLHDFTLRNGVASDLATLAAIDDDAGTLFEEAGLFLDLPDDHEFPAAERRRWQECIAAGSTLLAVDLHSEAMGFVAVGRKDDEPYVAQLSVRRSCMRQGIGSALLEAAGHMAHAAGGDALWLTTYDHLSWNRPFYERHGFIVMPEQACGAELLAEHAIEKKWLPLSHQRVLMRKALAAVRARR